jgi:rhamnosyltransferase
MIIVEQEKVEIVLATYNGEKYLREQLESILNQSYSNIIITIWDDGSIDSTNEILQGYQTVFSDRIRIIENVGVSLGVIGSFSRLLEHTQSEYVFLSDQDDYWVQGKVQKQIDLIHKMEQKWGKDEGVRKVV